MASFDSFEEIHHQAPHGSFVEIEDEMDFSNFSSYTNVNPGPDEDEEVIPVPVSSQDTFVFGSSMDSSPFAPIHENGHNNDYGSAPDGPILPPPSEMGADEGYALREWRRQNAVYLQEKEVAEKQMRVQIIKEGEEYIKGFYEKRHLNIETNKVNNREREKLHAENQEKFHKEAGNLYWKTIAELIPNEVPNIEKKGRKKDQEKKPSITVIQGPKPGKPTDLSRMRHILLKLKHAPPPHMVVPPPAKDKDAKPGKGDSSDGSSAKVVANGSVDAAKPDGAAPPTQPPADAAKNAAV